MASPAAERGREVRQRLLAAAVELIPERGWSAVSTRVLAERAGVTPSVVHYHFPSMPALLNEAAVGLMCQIVAESGSFLDSVDTPEAGVEAMLASVAQYTGADPRSLVFVEAYLAATRDEQLHARLAGVAEELRRGFATWLDEHGVPDPDATAAVLAALIDGLLLHRGLGSSPDPGQVVAVVQRMVRKGNR